MQRARGLLTRATILFLVLGLLPQAVSAAQITSRKVTLSSSNPAASNATTTYTFNFTVPTTTTAIKSWEALVCTTASGTCTMPTGFSNTSGPSVLSSQPTGMGAASGWTINTATLGSLRILDAANATNPSGSQTIVIGNVQNPTTTNTSYYLRLTTFSDSAWTTAIDTGVVAASTATQIQLTGTMPESLVFCTGGTVTGTDCSTATSGSVSFNQLFSSTTTATATSQMVASTNASSGYVVTVNGLTLTSGANTITAMSSSTTSVVGTKQFGLNVVANTTPSVGAAITPAANGTNLKGEGSAGYGTANNFKFVTGDTVADSANGGSGPTDAQNFTVSYIANVSGSQAAGVYTTTLTYICTATF